MAELRKIIPMGLSTPASTTAPPAPANHLKHKRRFCRMEGCNSIVKSQGLCQRHGAKPRKCKVEGCDKQAQGNFDKMCKSHFKAMKRATTPLPAVVLDKPPPPAEGISVYDHTLPASITFAPQKGTVMPLIAHLKAGFDGLKPPAWHRNEERRARGMHPVQNPAAQLEGWERELVWMEILVLTGAPGASFRHLARAWGRDKGFHMVLAQFICSRQGDVQRKKRLAEKSEESKKISSRGPAKKRRRGKKEHSRDVSADIWDDSAYSDAITNEALAADIFDFSAQEFETAAAMQRWKYMEDGSDTTSLDSRRSGPSAAAAATQAILGERGGMKMMLRKTSGSSTTGHQPPQHPSEAHPTQSYATESHGEPQQQYEQPQNHHQYNHFEQSQQQQHQHQLPIHSKVSQYEQPPVEQQQTYEPQLQYQQHQGQHQYQHLEHDHAQHGQPQETQYAPAPVPIHYATQGQSQQHHPSQYETQQEQPHYVSALSEHQHSHQQPIVTQEYQENQEHVQDRNQQNTPNSQYEQGRREHPEQNPETSAVPPELAHPRGQYPQGDNGRY